MAERRKLSDIIFNRNKNEEKYYNFFRDDIGVYGGNSFIWGYNTRAGEFDVNNIGNGQSNSAVVACLQTLGVSFSEASLLVKTYNQEDEMETIYNHPFELLLKRPNPYMSGDILQQYFINAIHVSGDAYILKQKNEAGQVVSLYPLMPELVTPKGTNEELITHYEYETQKQGLSIIMRDDIIHLRLGLDPTDHKSGFSPLKSVLREIYGDESAGQLSTALLANSGVPSVIISPKDGYGPTSEEAEQIVKTYREKVGGRNRGMPLVLSGAMSVEKMSFSPNELDIGKLRHISEERISAVLGVPAILAGLGAGLERATYSNAGQLREYFTENKLIPLWRMIGQELSHQLLNVDFHTEQYQEAYYDFSDVRALQQDEDDMYRRLAVGVNAGIMTIAEARRAIGLDTEESDEVYLMPNNKIAVPKEELATFTAVQELPNEPAIELNNFENDLEKKVIREENGEFCVYSEDTNRSFGCYPNEELAQARLEQIHRFGENSYNGGN